MGHSFNRIERNRKEKIPYDAFVRKLVSVKLYPYYKHKYELGQVGQDVSVFLTVNYKQKCLRAPHPDPETTIVYESPGESFPW